LTGIFHFRVLYSIRPAAWRCADFTRNCQASFKMSPVLPH
jgi:hypothetical protein